MVGCHQSAFFLLLALAAAEAGHFQGHKRRVFGIQRPQKILTPLPRTPVPDQWHWSNVSGVNYLTQAKNQHIPQYCGSCWAQAATSSMSDRIKIARKAAWPDINIAPQVLISCGPNDGCHGGDAGEANKWIAEHGNEQTRESRKESTQFSPFFQASPMKRVRSTKPGDTITVSRVRNWRSAKPATRTKAVRCPSGTSDTPSRNTPTSRETTKASRSRT